MNETPEATIGTGWAINGRQFYKVGATSTKLLPGLYSCGYANGVGPFVSLMDNKVDELIELPDSESEKLLEEIVQFRRLKEKFAEHGFLYKRGILLYGPPGSGKTATIQQLIKLFTQDGIAVMMNGAHVTGMCLQMIRQVEPERQLLVIMEDLDALIEDDDESQILSLLDGENQIENVVFVATTNYPEKLDRRFKDRPSRFDTIRLIDMPSPAARRAYLVAKLPTLTSAEIDGYVLGTEGFSVAYLRELIVLTQCFGMKLEAALERLNFMRENMPESSDEGRLSKKNIGSSLDELFVDVQTASQQLDAVAESLAQPTVLSAPEQEAT